MANCGLSSPFWAKRCWIYMLLDGLGKPSVNLHERIRFRLKMGQVAL